MAANTEILDYGVSGQTIYAWIRSRSSGLFWNGTAMEAYLGADYANYDVAMPEMATSGAYIFTTPPTLPVDEYDILCRLQRGATPAENDIPLSEISRGWDGVNLIQPGGGGGGVVTSRYQQYPTASDLSAFLADASLNAPGPDQLEIAVLAGIEDLENRCMRHFLAGYNVDNTPQAPYGRRYDPATTRISGTYGAMLDLAPMGDLARLDSVIYQPDTRPEIWVDGKQFRAMPVSAAARHMPIRWLELLPQWLSPAYPALWGAVQVTGLWGYGLKIAADVWQAFLANASLMLFSRQFRGAGVPLGLKSWTGPEGIKKEYDASMLTARIKEWQDVVTTTVPQNGAWGFG
jgi:hypothetical protein